MTELLNRTAILDALAVETNRAQREHRTVLIVLADIDHFKQINDRYGHLAGDEALRVFAQRVRDATRPYDHIGRYGGEEFLIILGQTPGDVALQRLATLHETISNASVQFDGKVIAMNCSMGAAIYAPHMGSVTAEEIISVADKALYIAKSAGRNLAIFRCICGKECPCDCTQAATGCTDGSSNL